MEVKDKGSNICIRFNKNSILGLCFEKDHLAMNVSYFIVLRMLAVHLIRHICFLLQSRRRSSWMLQFPGSESEKQDQSA